MFTGTYVTELTSNRQIEIPADLRNRLKLEAGDKVEITIKRIRSRRLEISIGKNPLIKLLSMDEEEQKHT
jgi:AbrB family looped-hinge helix DNA binding protein